MPTGRYARTGTGAGVQGACPLAGVWGLGPRCHSGEIMAPSASTPHLISKRAHLTESRALTYRY
ncbi:hypothetical protein Atai01_43400 [Amycolatopsis taiwanensis]|uniref:Uncharacterized protein n=1 Tax=Amycolatopsis taiwanensis TaxID=342230 RepID=A0A9W6R192_9PSEU|nr:hypothetical protein Atai01_43400 [Amycolatopsis taiwanensis]